MGKELHIEPMPELSKPILIFGFAGWANGANVAVGMIDYLIQKLEATPRTSSSDQGNHEVQDRGPISHACEGGREGDLSR
jgi:hypothetical protein